jgi:alpha-tubulin suppressor-like RCC1 family protein
VLALDSTGQLYGWGDNSYWVSGDRQYSTHSIVKNPHPVPGMSKVIQIGCGISYYVALKQDGTVWAWGSNPGSGDGPALESSTPRQLAGFSDIVSISVGPMHLLAVKKDGTVWAWGYNMNGELGNGKITALGGESHAVQVADLYVESPSGTDAVNATPVPTTVSGFNFNTMGTLGCLLVIVGLLSGFSRGKSG